MKLKNNKYFLSFFLVFVSMILIQLPNIILNGGYFIYAGDYNYQHITFTVHAYDVIRAGKFNWDWSTTFGVDFLTSYSHIIFSPFFLLTLLLPSKETVIFSIPIVTALKVGVSALTSYIYIRRYTKTDNTALIGSICYALSGFQAYNLIFGSFNDITAVFPLMLYFLDEYMYNNRKIMFMLVVAYMSAINAFFFYGQVMFILIYFSIKVIMKEYNFTLKKFFGLAIESVIGVIISAVLLYPNLKVLLSNSRVSNYIHGMDMISYNDRSIVFRIIQSIFMMPDVASSSSLFYSESTWNSISLYLPFIGIIFIVAYICTYKKSWISFLLVICLFMACVPVFNSIFFMFNSSFYARWFYMPILIMALATSLSIENFDKNKIIFGIKIMSIGLLLFIVISILPDEQNNDIKFFQFPHDAIFVWRTIGLSGLCILFAYNLISNCSEKNIFIRKLSIYILVFGIFQNIIYIYDTKEKVDASSNSIFKESSIDSLDMPDSHQKFYRMNADMINSNIMWNIPGMDNFITIYPKSISDFYNEFGIGIMQNIYYNPKYYPINALLSVKYALNSSTGDDLNVEYFDFNTKGFEKYSIVPYHYIYENINFVPIGFCYDYCISYSKMDSVIEEYELQHTVVNSTSEKSESILDILGESRASKFKFNEKYLQKALIMMRAMVLSDEDSERYKDILPEISDEDINSVNENTYYSDGAQRAEYSCYEFNYDGKGFRGKINSEKENLIFFSVPYVEGWSAQVNGKDAEIILSNYGFMAVKIDKGDNDIEFRYLNKNYITGAYISIAGLILLAIYVVFNKRDKYEKK